MFLRLIDGIRTMQEIRAANPFPRGQRLCVVHRREVMSDRTKKLVSIRNRTDRDLMILVQRELDRGLILVAVATTRTSALFAQAEKSYKIATTILPRISGISQDDRLRIELSLRELRSRLDQLPTFAKVGRYTASVA
jgi:hypothetical protein